MSHEASQTNIIDPSGSIKLAVLETKVAAIEASNVRIETKLDTLSTDINDKLVKKSELTEIHKELKEKNETLEKALKRIADSKTTENWILRIGIIVSFAISIITLRELLWK